MKRINFDYELAKEIVAGKREGRIVTGEGDEVKILTFSASDKNYPIIGEKGKTIQKWSKVGQFYADTKSINDLFIELFTTDIDFLGRLKKELADLKKKRHSLEQYIDGKHEVKNCGEYVGLMALQSKVMDIYIDILCDRIRLIKHDIWHQSTGH